MRFLIIIGLNLCLLKLGLSQEDFKSGYLIDLKSDTIYGLIQNRGSINNAKLCSFKRNIQSEKQLFTPNEIIAYRFTDGKYYVSDSILVDNIRKAVFMEYLINGVVDIYYFRDINQDRYFISDEKNDLAELRNDQKTVFKDGYEYVKESKEYVGTLKYLLKDSPSISQKVNSVKLNHNSLIDISSKYHSAVCADKECVIFEKDLIKTKFMFGPVVSINSLFIISPTKFDQEYFYLKELQYNSIVIPTFGISIKKDMPFINERIWMQYDCLIGQEKLSAKAVTENASFQLRYIYGISLQQITLQNNVYLKYHFVGKKLRPSVNVGLIAKNSLKFEYLRIIQLQNFGEETPYKETEYTENPLTKYQFGIAMGTGVTISLPSNHEIDLNLRYVRSINSLTYQSTHGVVFSVGYML